MFFFFFLHQIAFQNSLIFPLVIRKAPRENCTDRRLFFSFRFYEWQIYEYMQLKKQTNKQKKKKTEQTV